MSDPSNLNSPFVETTYQDWSAANPYENPLESYGRYTENVRNEYLDAGKYDEIVESQLNYNLSRSLSSEGILTEDNSQEIEDILSSYSGPDLGSSIKTLLDEEDPENQYLSEEDKQKLNLYATAQEVDEDASPFDFDPEQALELSEIIRRTNEKKFTDKFKKGELLAAVIEDEEGNEFFLGGNIPEGMTESEVIKESAKYGVTPKHLFNLRYKREDHPVAKGLKRYEVDQRLLAERDVKEVLENFDPANKAALYGLAKNYGENATWDNWDKFNDWATDGFGDFIRTFRIGWNDIVGDDELRDELIDESSKETLQDYYQERTDLAKLNLIANLSEATGYSGEILEDVVSELIVKYAFEGDTKENVKPFLKYSDNKEELGQNVFQTRYSGVLVSNELMLSPVDFNTALRQANVTGEEAAQAESQRQLAVVDNFERISGLLSKDDAFSEEWGDALVEGRQLGLSNSTILEKFKSEFDFSPTLHRLKGVGSSVWEGLTSIAYGVGAAMDTDWGREGLLEIAEDNAHDREIAKVFGLEMGGEQDFAEAIAPLFADALVTAGLVLLTKPTAGTSLAGLAAYTGAKSTATASARAVISAASRGVLKTVGKETAEQAAERILKAGALKGATKERTLAVVKAYNGNIASKLGVGTAAFIPAATRSGANTYGAVFKTVSDDLTRKHKGEDGQWEEGWSEDRVKEESHDKAFGSALTAGTITGLLTSSFSVLGKGGLEDAFLQGMSFRQMRQITSNVLGRNVGDETFKALIKNSLKKVTRKHALIAAPTKFAKSVLDEGFEEGLDEFFNIIVQDIYTNQDTEMLDRMQQVWHGFVLGAGLGGAGNVVSKAAKNIAPDKFLDRAAAAQVEQEVFKQFEADVEAKGLGDKLRESGSPATAQEAERQVRQYKRSERPEMEARLSSAPIDEEEDALGAADVVIEEETKELTQEDLDRLNYELQTGVTSEAIQAEISNMQAQNLQQGNNPDVEGTAAEQALANSEGEAVAGSVAITSQHTAKKINQDYKQDYEATLLSVDAKRKLHQKMEKRIMALSGNPAIRANRELKLAENEGRAFSKKKAAFMRMKAKETLDANLVKQAESDAKGTKEIKASGIDSLVNAGFAHQLTLDQLERLGVATDKMDRASLNTLTKELKKRIQEKYPVQTDSFTKKASSMPKVYGGQGKVFLDDKGRGIFNNDPVAMLSFLESGIAIPVPSTAIDSGTINPSFEISPNGNPRYVTDIRVQESGGTVSAKTAFNKVGALEEDYSVIANLASRLNELKQNVNLNQLEDLKVVNPFNTRTKSIKLSTIYDRVKDFNTFTNIFENIYATDSSYKGMSKAFKDTANIAASLEMQISVLEYAQNVSANVEVDPVPFNASEVLRRQGKYAMGQQVARKKRATRSFVSVLDPNSNLYQSTNVEAAAKDTYVAPKPNPLPPLPTRKLKDYSASLIEEGAAAMESSPELVSKVAAIVNEEYHNDSGRAFDLEPSDLFDELIQFVSKGAFNNNQPLVDLQSDLKRGLFGEQGQTVRKVFRTLSLMNSNVDASIENDPAFLQEFKTDLQQIAGGDYTVTDDQVVTFYTDISKSQEANHQRAIVNGRSMDVNEAINRTHLEGLGISDNSPQGVIDALEKLTTFKNKKSALSPLGAAAEVFLTDTAFIRKIKFSFEATAANYAGKTYTDRNGVTNIVINIARDAEGGVSQTLVHELSHAFTNRVIDLPAEARTPEQNIAINRVESLIKLLRKRAARENAPDSVLYGLTNIEEFSAAIMTSREFQTFLSGMKVGEGQRSFLARAIEAISRLIARAGRAQAKADKAMQDVLTLVGKREFPDPETRTGFTNHVAATVTRRQTSRSRLATSIGMAEDITVNEALDNAAVEYFSFVVDYVPDEINVVMDNTTDVIAEWDAETESIIFNGRRAAAKVNQMVAAVNGAPIRRDHILAAILNEEIAHVASFARLSQAEIQTLMESLNDVDAQSIIEQYYPEGERAEALERFRSEDAAVSEAERFILAEEQLRIHVQKVLRGAETNEQVNFLLENPSTLDTVKRYFKNFLTKVTYARELKDVSPEMRDAVNRVVTEVRAMEAGYRLTPNGMHFDINNPEGGLNQILKQLEMHQSITPREDEVDEESPATPKLQSRWGSDAGTIPSDHTAVGKLVNGESVGGSAALPKQILADAKNPNKNVNVTLSHTNITLGRKSRESQADLEKYPLGVMPFSLEIDGSKYNAFNVRMRNAGAPNLNRTVYRNFLSKGSAGKYELTRDMKLIDVLDSINAAAKRTGVTSAINMTDIKLTNPQLKNKAPNSLIPEGTLVYAQGPKNVIGGPTGELVSANEDIDVSDMKEGWDALSYNPAMGNYMYRVSTDTAGRTRFYTQSKFVGADEMVMVSHLDTSSANPFQNFAIWVKGARYETVDPQVDPPAHETMKSLIDAKQSDPTPLKPTLQSRIGSDTDLTMESFKVNSYPTELGLFKTKAGKLKGAPPQVKSTQDVTKLMTRLKKLTIEGAVGRYWYENAAAKILDIANGDVAEAEKFISLLAIYSPQTGVEVNTTFAVRAYEQHANGVSREDFGIKTGVQDDKARAVLYDAKPWTGRKTDNFYKNLMFHIVSEATPDQLASMQIDDAFLQDIQQPVTVDMWVYRAFGYDSIGLTDAKGQGAFGFSEKLINRLAYALNQNLPEGADPYQAHQIQAMIWTAIKARSEQKAVRDKTEAQSEQAGHLVFKKDAKGKKVRTFPTKEGERKHQLRWTKNALEAEGVDFLEASRSFDYFVDTMGMTATWEVIPSTTTEAGKKLAAMSFAEKRDFTQKAMELIVDPATGEDLLARELGVSLFTAQGSAGGYAGGVTPNVISTIYPNKPAGKYDDDSIRAYARALQFIFKQDAVPWSRLIKTTKEDLKYKVVNQDGRTIRKFDSQGEAEDYAAKSEKDYTVVGGEQSFGVKLAFEEELTEGKLQEIQEYLTSVDSDLGFTQTSDNVIIVVNYKMDYNNMLPALTDEDFNDKIIERYGKETEQTYFTTVGEYGYHDWSEDSEGTTIFETSPRFRPDLQAWIRDRRERFLRITPEAQVTPRLQSRYGANSYIPKELDAESVDFSNWVEMLDIPLMEFGTYKSPSSLFGKLIKGYADRDLIRLKEERDSFVREAKKLAEDFKEKHDRLIKEAEKNGIEIPPELISRASGSNQGTQLTEEQIDNVEARFDKERAKANRATDPKRRTLLLEIAEKNKLENTKNLRLENRKALLADRDQALKDLLAISSEAHTLILDLRKLIDDLSAKGNELFSDFIQGKDEFNAVFDMNGGLYITRRYRMFEDNDYLARVRDETDPTYAQERQDAINYFSKQYMDYHVAREMEKGLSKKDARFNVQLDLEQKGSSARTKGKDLMTEFLNAYEQRAVTKELDIYQSADGGRSIMMNEKKFKGSVLNALAKNLNQKQNIPAPIRRLLGEFGDESASGNLAHTLVHTSTVMANQAFFNRIVEYGSKGKNPWLVTAKMIEEDLDLPVSQQKYTGWQKLKGDGGPTDWNPLKDYYTKPEIVKDFDDLINMSKAEVATKETSSPSVYVASKLLGYLHRATGLSLAAKTLGSTGFYVRNMLGNAMFFGPMQGYMGGVGKAFGELGGVGMSFFGDAENSKSQIVRAAIGSRAAMDAELTVLSSMNVFGDELEANLLRDLLTGKMTIPSAENKLAGIAKKVEDKLKIGKKAYEEAVATATRLASAMDAYYKIGLYEFELDTLLRAAKADPAGGEFARLLDADGNPSVDMKRAAAVKVKKVSQAYSQAPPIIKALTRHPVGLLVAPYVRFAAEIPRVTANTFSLIREERRQGKTNPVMKARYRKRLSGMIGTMSFTFAVPAFLKALAGIGEDEDEALRLGMPFYLRDHTFYYLKEKDGDIWSLDLTYLNPFSVIADPVARSFEALFDEGEINPLDAGAELLGGLFRPYFNEQILSGAVSDVVTNENQYGDKIRYGDDMGKNFLRGFQYIWEKSYEPRALAKLRQAFRAAEGDSPSNDMFASPLGLIFGELLPVKPHKLDLNSSLRNYLRTHTDDYREINSKQNALLSPKSSMLDGDIYDIYDDIYTTRLSLNNEFRRITRAYNKLGIRWNEIQAQAKSRGVSKERLRLNYNGWMNRPVLSKFIEDRLKTNRVGRSRSRKFFRYGTQYERFIQLED